MQHYSELARDQLCEVNGKAYNFLTSTLTLVKII